MADDYELLNLGGLTSLVANVKVSLWGNQIVFECIYDPTGDRSPVGSYFMTAEILVGRFSILKMSKILKLI